MVTNFDFLKRNDKNLFEIINDAEKLYQEEFFEQCMTQTRRFGEIVCKNVLGSRRTTEVSFDAMLATLKDCTLGSSQEAKDFVEDLYFLKRHGNHATHSIKVNQDGLEALECLKRAFEIAINYCVYSCNEDRRILKLKYDTELLVTGKKSRKTLSDKYKEQKSKKNIDNTKKTAITTQKKQYCSVKSKPQKPKPKYFWYFVGFSAVISTILLIFMIFI